MANTKAKSFGLNKFDLREAITEFEDSMGDFFILENKGIVVCAYKVFPNANTVRVSVAIMSPDEKKFRPNIGKYLAGKKMFWDLEYINIPDYSLVAFVDALDM